ncbi:hypothetical protein [Agromyces larvae]|uniref:Uncharacterized protein n=1 Tax=Agromyces larvae TaxID=2929802 RepID=A0ABY4C1C6_9MICO|nr:hypothetical protein [Agromyces larvae]UOE43751.1 hypothetical protein MTO99_16505 [Agromyces larvae]
MRLDDPQMNKTLITLGFLILILGAIVGDIVLSVVRPEALDTFNGSVVTILGVGTAAVVTFYGLGTQGEKLKKIESNTNGTLSTLVEENKRLTLLLQERGVDTTEIQVQHSADDPGRHVA